jgi:hypothetical protein
LELSVRPPYPQSKPEAQAFFKSGITDLVATRVSVRRDLPGARHWRRGDHAGGQRRGHERAEHLAETSPCVSVDVIASLMLDGAGWHSSPRLRVSENIVLLSLLPYAPELNTAKIVGNFLWTNFLSLSRLGHLQGRWSMRAAMPGKSSCKYPTASHPSPGVHGQAGHRIGQPA